MLQYMRKIWREEYWASDDIDHIYRCGKMVRAVDFQNPRGEVVGYVDVPVLNGMGDFTERETKSADHEIHDEEKMR